MEKFMKRAVMLFAVLFSLNVNAAQQLYYIHSDHLNTPQALTDSNQQVVWRVEQQTPFGEVEVNEDPDGDGDDVVFNLRFPGQYFDEETNTNYNYYRTYDPGLGRYIQSDPKGLIDGPNTYLYTRGNPIKFTDPRGENSLVLCFGGPIPCVVGVGLGIATGIAIVSSTGRSNSSSSDSYYGSYDPIFGSEVSGPICMAGEGSSENEEVDCFAVYQDCEAELGIEFWSNMSPSEYRAAFRACVKAKAPECL